MPTNSHNSLMPGAAWDTAQTGMCVLWENMEVENAIRLTEKGEEACSER
jgi:hypothetical protein